MNKDVYYISQLLLCLVLCLFPKDLHAQDMISLSGKVTVKNTGEPLSEVVVSVRLAGKTIKFTRTGKDGCYKLQLNSKPEKTVLHFSMIGFAPVDVAIVPNQYQYHVKLVEQETVLKEVVIKAPNIRQRGDTVLYNVSSYASISDKSLADVLKKMPGIEVSDKGEIKYNGVSINKFYIEGHDMLGGKYGLATNNIHHGDVGTVEVIENHQPIKALDDISFSHQPAINIRLKESAKKRLVGTMNIGGGINPGLWKDELTLMRFTKSMQTLNVLKTNNTGDNILSESSMLFSESSREPFPKSYKMKDYINVSPERLVDIDEQRVRRNQSQSVNINNLWSLGKNADLSIVINYGHERLLTDSYASTSYFLSDSTVIIDEDEAAKTHHHELAADITLLKNTEKYYLNNKLSINFDWNDTDIKMGGTLPNVQTASIPHYKVQDNFELIKRNGNKTYTLYSYNSYQVAPHHLNVCREGKTYCQDTRSISFYTNTNTSLGFSFKPVTIWLKTGITAMNRTMRSEAVGIPETLGAPINNISMSNLNVFVSPIVELKTEWLNAKLEVPMTIAPYKYENKQNSSQETCVKWIASPYIYLQTYLSSSFSLTMSGQIAQSAVDEQRFYDGLMMNDYRVLSQGLIDFNTDIRKTATLGWSYKKPIQAFFANMSVTRSLIDYKRLTDRTFTEDFIIMSNMAQRHTGRSWVVQGTVSKGLDFMKGLIVITPSYIYVDGQLNQNGLLSPFASKSWLVNTRLKSSMSKYVDLTYEFNYASDEMRAKDSGVKNTTYSLVQRFIANVKFSNYFFVTLKGEYYNNQVSESNRKRLLLGDISMTYSTKSGWEFSVEARNVFNHKTYAYITYSDLLAVGKEYTIRPRNIIASVFFHF